MDSKARNIVNQSKVYAVKAQAIGQTPACWNLWRVGTGPGRAEGQGFATLKEAKAWAKEWGHRWAGIKCRRCGRVNKSQDYEMDWCRNVEACKRRCGGIF